MAAYKKYSKVSDTPLFKQLAGRVVESIESGEYKPEDSLPSLNAMSIATGLSKETVVKAYSYLCKRGIINAMQGKGYFIKKSYLSGRLSILVILDKMSQHQRDILDGLVENIGDSADITIRMHYQNLFWFESTLDEVLDKYDWYLVFPHFPTDTSSQKKANTLLSRIPSEKLIVLDRLPIGLEGSFGASYQSIELDIPSTLVTAIDDIRKFNHFSFIPLSNSLYKSIVSEVFDNFCREYSIAGESLPDVPKEIKKGDLYFVSGSSLDKRLSLLIKTIWSFNLEIGKDVGLICYNDFPLNEFILGGLTTLSTDFTLMGKTAAQMIQSGQVQKIKAPCSLIRRATF